MRQMFMIDFTKALTRNIYINNYKMEVNTGDDDDLVECDKSAKIEIISDICIIDGSKNVSTDLENKNPEKDIVEDMQVEEDASIDPIAIAQISQKLSTEFGKLDTYKTDDTVLNMFANMMKSSDENKTDAEMDAGQEEITIESTYFPEGTLIELSRYSWISTEEKQRYVQGCLWSPDGTCILTAVHLDGMHLVELPTELYTIDSVSHNRPLDTLTSAVHIKEGGTVYDYCWYPFMNSDLPETSCWISTRKHDPIQMWDAFNGELRCSYRGYDNVDEVETAISISFSSNGQQIYGGYKKNIKIFDTSVPGRDYTEIPIKEPCSCISVNNTHNDIIATGSWNCLVKLYDLRAINLGSIATFSEHVGGVTLLKHSSNGETLFSGARKDSQLLEWDLRNFSTPINKFSRQVNTSQRIHFDVSPEQLWLASGDTSGLVHIWDRQGNNHASNQEYQFSLHRDCCNGVNFHPNRSILATASGQYHIVELSEDDDANVKLYENSLMFWWLGSRKT